MSLRKLGDLRLSATITGPDGLLYRRLRLHQTRYQSKKRKSTMTPQIPTVIQKA